MASNREQGEKEKRKHEEEVNLNMQLLRSQYEQAEIKLSAAQSALDESLRETGKFKKANEKLKRDNDEVVKLRGQTVELRRLVKTFDASNKKSKMKKERERERERERESGRNRASRGASDEETKELTVLVHRAADLEKKRSPSQLPCGRCSTLLEIMWPDQCLQVSPAPHLLSTAAS